jgi:glycosyltransferase involved in cell wall biosynthesis
MTDMLAPRVDIIIPTFNRAHQIVTAVRAAIEQSWWKIRVTVVDDAGIDDTKKALAPYFDHDNFNYIRLNRNLGTASAKNVGLLLTDGDAITFHDSDDIPHRDKILRQVRSLTAQGLQADECLNWTLAHREPGATLEVGAVLVHHELILPDGRRMAIRRDLSLVDDLFPNLQLGSGAAGEWTHVNSGLFRHDLFARLGGFADCIEEDREFRNRMILSGEIVRILPELLLTKIETADSLTQSMESDYKSARRVEDRTDVWAKVAHWRKTGEVSPVSIDIPEFDVDFVSNPALLARREIPCAQGTRQSVLRILDRMNFGRHQGVAAQ